LLPLNKATAMDGSFFCFFALGEGGDPGNAQGGKRASGRLVCNLVPNAVL
jgi:hypothetical protein